MTAAPILLTSFQSWRSHQRSNSSDDLLCALQSQGRLPANSILLRNLPVSFDLAPIEVSSELRRQKPRAVVCCGMAEKRAYLSWEQQAKRAGRQTLQTSFNLKRLIYQTQLSQISYDAGSYVCNHLYYSVLEAAFAQHEPPSVVFAHVPVLRASTRRFIQRDFFKILHRIANQI